MSYYNRYTRATGWKDLLFQGGRGLQSAELNELQAVLTDERAQLASLITREGTVRGCEILVDGTTVTITPGQVYFGRYFHDVPGGDVTITGVGEERIGIRFTEVEVDEIADPTLLDPALNWSNFGQAGAHRLTFSSTITVDDDSALYLYTLRNGEVVSEPSTEYGELLDLLARRTQDESGSYLVRGMRVSIEPLDASQYYAVIGAGKAYVLGYEINVPANFRVPVNRPLATRTVTNEVQIYDDLVTLYPLNAQPVAAIVQVTATVEVTQSITRGGTPGGVDTLPLTPVVSIELVEQGATTYTVTTDYVRVGDTIDWSPGGIEPGTGTSYDVTWRYIATLTDDTDYQLTGNDLEILGVLEPVDGTAMNVTYTAYLPRHDLVVMDRHGTVTPIEGQSSIYPSAPPQPGNTLLLAELRFAANAAAEDVVVLGSGLYRQTMPELSTLKNRVQNLEYNAAVTDLEQAALNVELPTTKKGIFTDVFRDLTKADPDHGDWSAAISTLNRTLTPSFAVDFQDCPAPLTGAHVMLNYTEQLFQAQPLGTELVLVNAYATFSNAGVITLDPSDDRWIEEDNILVDEGGPTIPRYFRHLRDFWQWMRRLGGEWEVDVTRSRTHWLLRLFGFQRLTATVDTVVSTEEQFVEGFSRAQTIAVRGEAFTPDANNLALSFDGTGYDLTPTGSTVAGSNAGTVRANASGAFTATFDLPAGVPGGTKEVLVTNNVNTGRTQFEIGHTLRTNRVRRQTVNIDPVAQSFLVEDTVAITAVDLYFGAKDATLPVVVSIRSMVNGYPGIDVFAERVVPAASVTTSADGSTATTVTFIRPALLEPGEYCLVIASESDQYSVAVGRLGERDLINGEYVASNAAPGILFSSANARTWTADQAADLKFRLYRAQFVANALRAFGVDGTPDTQVGNATLLLDNLTVDASLFYLMADQLTPVGCRLRWEISHDDGSTWSRFEADEEIDTRATHTDARVRVAFEGDAAGRASPMLALPVSLLAVKWDATGAYVSRNVELGQAYTSLYVYLDADIPSGTTLTGDYSTNGGSSWTTLGGFTLQQAVDSDYNEYLAFVTGLSSPTQFRVRLNFTANGARSLVPSVRRLRVITT